MFLHSADRRSVKQIGVVFEAACQWTIRVTDLYRQIELPCGLRYHIRFEMKLIARALELTNGNQARAARLLGLGTTTLNYKIKSCSRIVGIGPSKSDQKRSMQR